MMFRRFLVTFGIAAYMATAAFLSVPAFAQNKADEKAKSAFTDAQRSELNALMKQFILDNPQALITSVETYYNKQNDTKKAQEGRVDQVPAGLYDNPNTPFVGDKNAKFVIVEFFDYNCGYCKQVAGDVQRLVNEEKSIKFIFKDLPILSEMSEVAARYALAANKQGKYLEYHMALMEHQGPMDPGFLEKTAKDIGLDVAKLKKDADTQDVRDTLNKNLDLARELGIRGTPFFLVGKAKVPGAIGYTKMKELIAHERDGVTTPAAPSPTTSESPAPAAVVDTTGSSAAGVDPDVKAAIDDAKKETNDLLNELKKQAEDMKKAAEDMAKQEAAKNASGTTAPAAPAEKK